MVPCYCVISRKSNTFRHQQMNTRQWGWDNNFRSTLKMTLITYFALLKVIAPEISLLLSQYCLPRTADLLACFRRCQCGAKWHGLDFLAQFFPIFIQSFPKGRGMRILFEICIEKGREMSHCQHMVGVHRCRRSQSKVSEPHTMCAAQFSPVYSETSNSFSARIHSSHTNWACFTVSPGSHPCSSPQNHVVRPCWGTLCNPKHWIQKW